MKPSSLKISVFVVGEKYMVEHHDPIFAKLAPDGDDAGSAVIYRNSRDRGNS